MTALAPLCMKRFLSADETEIKGERRKTNKRMKGRKGKNEIRGKSEKGRNEEKEQERKTVVTVEELLPSVLYGI